MKGGVTIDDVRSAAKRLSGVVVRTQVTRFDAVDATAGREVFFKCEHMQHAGAFKFRGASNAVMQLGEEEAARGVVTHSSGNHAQALALAAKRRGIPAWIVMPENAITCKRAATEAHGAVIVDCEPTLQAREDVSARVLRETGGTLIHPYDDPRIIAGQGTAALELLEDVPDLDAIVTPVGGGGLLSGTAIAAGGVAVFGAEPSGADDAARSLAGGRLVPQDNPQTICDGLRTGLGQWTWPIIRDHVAAIVTVDDAAAAAAQAMLLEHAGLHVEINAAIALAAVLDEEFPRAMRVGIILSGGNLPTSR